MWELVGERRRETEKRERRGIETDVPNLYTYNEYELSVKLRSNQLIFFIE